MRVYFTKLEDDQWVCHEELTPVNCLLVDPAKIDELTKLFPPAHVIVKNNPHATWVTLMQTTTVQALGFGNIKLNQYVDICNGLIRDSVFRDDQGSIIASFPYRFMLDLPNMPAFEAYPIEDVDNV